MVSRSRQLKWLGFFILLLLTVAIPVSHAQYANPSFEGVTQAAFDAAKVDDWSRSSIAMPATKNWTFSFSNSSVIELPSQMSSPLMTIDSPTMLKIDVVRGFEPEQRLNSQFDPALYRRSTDYSTLIRTNNGFSFKFNTTTYPSYAVYNLSFTNPFIVSRTDVLSLAFSTSNNFNSSQALIGTSLILRDDNNNRHYVSVVISDQHSVDSFGLSPWFLGEGFSAELPEYPYYSLKYGSLNGPWFRQLGLSEALTALNLPTAWIDGLLVGGEIGYIGPPLWVKNGAPAYSMTEVDAMFYFTLIHPSLF